MKMDFGMMEIKRIRNKAGDTTINGNRNFDATGKLKTIKKNPSAVEILTRMKDEKKTTKKIAKQEISKTKGAEVKVEDLITALKGTLVTDQDELGYVNFRYPGSKRILFYCIGRKNFITVSTKNDSTKSGWKSQRITDKESLKAFVEAIKAQVGGGN